MREASGRLDAGGTPALAGEYNVIRSSIKSLHSLTLAATTATHHSYDIDSVPTLERTREAPLPMLKVYTLSNCSTCRDATKWLRKHDLAFEELAIRETPPTLKELRAMLKSCDGELRRLFNTSGQDYREQKVAEKLPKMSVEDALSLLANNGRLVKRPFLIGDGIALVGFNEDRWSAALAKK